MNHVYTVHPSARTTTARVQLKPSQPLSLPPHLLRLHDPCARGRESHTACTSVTHVDTVLDGGLVGIHALQADGLALVHTPSTRVRESSGTALSTGQKGQHTQPHTHRAVRGQRTDCWAKARSTSTVLSSGRRVWCLWRAHAITASPTSGQLYVTVTLAPTPTLSTSCHQQLGRNQTHPRALVRRKTARPAATQQTNQHGSLVVLGTWG